MQYGIPVPVEQVGRYVYDTEAYAGVVDLLRIPHTRRSLIFSTYKHPTRLSVASSGALRRLSKETGYVYRDCGLELTTTTLKEICLTIKIVGCEASLGTAILVAARPESAHRLQNMPISWGIDNERNNGSEFNHEAVVRPWKKRYSRATSRRDSSILHKHLMQAIWMLFEVSDNHVDVLSHNFHNLARNVIGRSGARPGLGSS